MLASLHRCVKPHIYSFKVDCIISQARIDKRYTQCSEYLLCALNMVTSINIKAITSIKNVFPAILLLNVKLLSQYKQELK